MKLASSDGGDDSPDFARPDIDLVDPRLAGRAHLDKAPGVPVGNFVQGASDILGHDLGLTGCEIGDPDCRRISQNVQEHGRLIAPCLVSDRVQIPEQHFGVHTFHREAPNALGGVGFDANRRKSSISRDGRRRVLTFVGAGDPGFASGGEIVAVDFGLDTVPVVVLRRVQE